MTTGVHKNFSQQLKKIIINVKYEDFFCTYYCFMVVFKDFLNISFQKYILLKLVEALFALWFLLLFRLFLLLVNLLTCFLYYSSFCKNAYFFLYPTLFHPASVYPGCTVYTVRTVYTRLFARATLWYTCTYTVEYSVICTWRLRPKRICSCISTFYWQYGTVYSL